MILARSAGKKKWPKWPHAVAFSWGFCNALLSDNSRALADGCDYRGQADSRSRFVPRLPAGTDVT